MQGKIKRYGASGGDKINGIIEEYVAQGNISAGGFVEYVNDMQYGTDTSLSSLNYSGMYISAILLSENKVFIVHSYGSDYYLYGMICTINGTNITAGTDTALKNNESQSGRYSISAVALSENKVFIAHNYASSQILYRNSL